MPCCIRGIGTGNTLLDPAMPHGLAIWTLLGVGVISTISHIFVSYARAPPAAERTKKSV